MPTPVYTLDLNFQGIPHVIASYLIRHAHGAVLIESGPGSTIEGLKSGLKEFDLTPSNITDVLLTHIHLDHAGASGWLARQGVRIHVHPNGAPHLRNPEKLLSSAKRIYGDMLDQLWGEFLPVPVDYLIEHHDGEEIMIDGLRFCALDTPGHADHHFAYVFEDLCFSGDIGGVRMPGLRYVRVPMPPPEFHLEKWRDSLTKLQQVHFARIAPTHFGIVDDPEWHLAAMMTALDDVEAWMEEVLPVDPPLNVISDRFTQWTWERSLRAGLSAEALAVYEASNPSWMSAAGMQRYWKKYRILS